MFDDILVVAAVATIAADAVAADPDGDAAVAVVTVKVLDARSRWNDRREELYL